MVYSALALRGFAGSEGEPALYAEAEIERGSEVSRVSVFVVNRQPRDIQFGTGAITGGGVVIKGQAGGGSGIFPPLIRFSAEKDTLTEVCVPSLTGGIGQSQRMQEFGLGSLERKLYYSFFVASSYLAGDFFGGTMDIDWNGVRTPLVIMRVIDRGPLYTNTLKVAADPATPIHANLDTQHTDPPPKFFPKIFGELVVRRGDAVSELEIWLASELNDPLDFLLYIPEGQQTVLPETRDSRPACVQFDSSFGHYALTPPLVRQRSAEPGFQPPDRRIRLEARQRILLHRFRVPTVYLAGGKGFEFGIIPTSRGIISIRVAKLLGPEDPSTADGVGAKRD